MTMTDPIADMLARINNANRARYDLVEIPSSKIKVEIARILKNEGYVEDVEETGEGINKALRITLKQGDEQRARITGVKRVSKPGLRVYTPVKDLPQVLGGMGTAIISTSVGIMTDKEARRKKVGGEVLAFIW
ncbi:MAG: 30S ribosomal protein S8 [Actinobacteria bacterium]|nr:30S ribosomal protein S8 [Actinomycetota bacterium]